MYTSIFGNRNPVICHSLELEFEDNFPSGSDLPLLFPMAVHCRKNICLLGGRSTSSRLLKTTHPVNHFFRRFAYNKCRPGTRTPDSERKKISESQRRRLPPERSSYLGSSRISKKHVLLSFQRWVRPGSRLVGKGANLISNLQMFRPTSDPPLSQSTTFSPRALPMRSNLGHSD